MSARTTPHASASETAFGEIELAFPFCAELVDDLKTEIPGSARRWDPDDRVWRVREPHAQAAVDLLVEHYPGATIPEAYRRIVPVVVAKRPSPAALDARIAEVMPPPRPASDDLAPIVVIIPCPTCGDRREQAVRVVTASAAAVAQQERAPAELLSVCPRCRTLLIVSFSPALASVAN